jgi:ATP-dependent RNA helicase RhlE
MWKSKASFQRHGSSNNRFRPIKTIPRQILLAEIARSKQSQNIQRNTPQVEHVVHTFTDFSFDARLLENIKGKGYESPTPIQDKIIPSILDGRDVIGTAHTGTGKTAAFLLPLIQKIIRDNAQRVLIITPTRELAYQIHVELRDFVRGLSIRSALLIGGSNEWRQVQDVRSDPHVVIATPGRLKDFIENRKIRLSGFRNVVLDEADRMVDIGFIKDINYFIALLPKARQSLFFSATISGKVGEILTHFVQNPVRVSIQSQDASTLIVQDVVKVTNSMSKEDMLHTMLLKKEFEKVLLFGRTKHGVQHLSDALNKRGVRSGAIHGNKRQNQRQQVLKQFMNSEIQILLATDVASRGLDIPNVSHVINYDLPETMDDYIHRIGRTGRADKQGIALTFID